MKGLLIKDFKLMKAQKNFFAVIVVVCFIMIATMEEATFAIGFLGFAGALFTLSSISYDEFDNGNAFLFSLPITRKTYVLEKYCFGLIASSCAWLFGVVISILFTVVNNSGSPLEQVLSAIVLFSVVVIMLAIMLPIDLKFGGERGRIVILAVVGIICVLGILARRIQNALKLDVSAAISWLSGIDESVFLVAAVVIALVALGLSYWISCRIIYKKEF